MTLPTLGVVLVAFNSADVIVECLESLFASRGAELAVVVVDNASTDDSRAVIERWASGAMPFSARPDCPIAIAPVAKPVALHVQDATDETVTTGPLTLIRSAVNTGFAGGVNIGLAQLSRRAEVSAFWVLNPDCIVATDTAARYLEAGGGQNFGMLSSRTLYYDRPGTIQTDGGRVFRWNGVCRGVNGGAPAATTPLPDAASLDFLTGANIVVSRAWLNRIGPMPEDYFLYYEEVDWAFSRDGFALELVPGATVYHHGGTSIGSGSHFQRPTAFSNYFNHRNRMRFVARHLPASRVGALGYTFAKAAQLGLKGARDEAWSMIAGAMELAPPPAVAARIKDPRARALAFGRHA